MQRYFLQISYKGTNFFGWQIQPNQHSVQAEFENVLTKINRTKEVKVVGCGRTDTGVHASQFYLHCDLDLEFSEEDMIFKLNSMLSKDIGVKEIFKVHSQAHARFDAKSRTYHYFIHQKKDPFIHEISWLNSQTFNIELMNSACRFLLDRTDFECFSKVKTDVNNFDCNISHASWIRTDKGLVFTITANRFLRNMVRAIVGTMLDIGSEKISIEEFKKILISKNRSEAGQSVPAHGLFLANIEYPKDIYPSNFSQS